MPLFRFSKPFSEQREKIKSKKRELSQINKELSATNDQATLISYRKRKKGVQQDIFKLERELRAVKLRADEPEIGALPDFVVIGGKKCGTTFLYYLLSQHPLVEPAADKEVHYFNRFFDEGTEWYRRCFPAPRLKNGRRTLTGEGTPEYLSHPLAPKRAADVIPQARLIALLRNPVDRTYSDYQMMVRKGRETRSFEEIIRAKKQRRPNKGDETSERGDGLNLQAARRKYVSKSIYVDLLLRWSEFFPKEQMLVLKSEDFFENPVESLKPVLDFLGLPDWEPETLEPRDEGGKDKFERNKRNKGTYEEGMDPATRERFEEYFEPHNQRLYDYLGRDFGW